MFTLAQNTLLANGHPLLSNIPPTIQIATTDDPFIAFLHISLDAPTHYATLPLGRLHLSHFLALYRNEPFWMRPAAGADPAAIPIETQCLFLQLPDHSLALLIPLIPPPNQPTAPQVRCSLQGPPPDSSSPNALHLIADTGSPSLQVSQFPALLLATGQNLQDLTHRAAQALAKHLHVPTRTQKSLPAFLDDFGWCTWDAFYHEVSHEKVQEGLTSLRDAGIPARLLILDDGWQSTRDFGDIQYKRLTSLRPNEKFHHDLSPTTRMAKHDFGIRHFLVWHAFQGYWAGLDPASFPDLPIAETPRHYSPGILHYMPEGNTKWWGALGGITSDPAKFFSAYHQLLASQGVDGVKVDNQSATESFSQKPGRVPLYRQYQQALESSCQSHFPATGPSTAPHSAKTGPSLLHCMSCANDLLYTSNLPLTRTSVDFWPDKPETHGIHLWANAAVATWFAHFIHPDWDMFHSLHPFAEFHAAARALSGGPIYISDKPHRHNPALLRRLMDSSGTILRANRPATLAEDSLFTDPTRDQTLLKIHTLARGDAAGEAVAAVAGAGVLGLFNCQPPSNNPQPATALARPSDIPDLVPAPHYLLHAAGDHLHTTRLIPADEPLPISLLPGQYQLLTFIPLNLPTPAVAAFPPIPVGLSQKFLPTLSILQQSPSPANPAAVSPTSLTLTPTFPNESLLLYLPTPLPTLTAKFQSTPLPIHLTDHLAEIPIPASRDPLTLHLTW